MRPIDDIRFSYEKIRGLGNPFFNNRVDDIWQYYPDSLIFNSGPFDKIYQEITNMMRDTTKQSIGCIIKGEAGTGKTHLLMRVAQQFSAHNPIMFIRPVSDVESVTYYIWINMIKSLVKKIPQNPAGNKCQLDELLTRIFDNILIPVFKAESSKGVKIFNEFLYTLQNDPRKGPELLKSEKHRKLFLSIILDRVRNEYSDADLSFVQALYKYYYLKDNNRRREIQSWLEGQIDDSDILKSIGLPSWIDDDQSIRDQIKKEKKAERGIQTLSFLAEKYYEEPLIICFDQLEGLRGKKALINRFVDVVRKIFAECKNLLIITCLFPSLLMEIENIADRSYIEKAGHLEIELDELEKDSAKEIVQKRLEYFYDNHNIKFQPNLNPFEESDIPNLLYYEVNDISSVKTVRHFISASRDEWDKWVKVKKIVQKSDLDETQSPPKDINQDSDVTIVVQNDAKQTEIEKYITTQINRLKSSKEKQILGDIANEEYLFPEIKEIIYFLMIKSNADIIPLERTTIVGTKKMPLYERFKFNGLREFCIAILNRTENEYTARIRNFLKYSTVSKASSIIVRDYRAGDFPRNGQGGIYLRNYLEMGNIISLNMEDISIIQIIYEAIKDIRNLEWEISDGYITLDDFYNWLMKFQFHMKSNFLALFYGLINTNSH